MVFFGILTGFDLRSIEFPGSVRSRVDDGDVCRRESIDCPGHQTQDRLDVFL